ncbi:hypothetical protein CBS101457_000136 [Exobasidium rhododendri]|nr:hypothetical protein CBS101457_000136 [Exobasidium rhododendri]
MNIDWSEFKDIYHSLSPVHEAPQSTSHKHTTNQENVQRSQLPMDSVLDDAHQQGIHDTSHSDNQIHDHLFYQNYHAYRQRGHKEYPHTLNPSDIQYSHQRSPRPSPSRAARNERHGKQPVLGSTSSSKVDQDQMTWYGDIHPYSSTLSSSYTGVPPSYANHLLHPYSSYGHPETLSPASSSQSYQQHISTPRPLSSHSQSFIEGSTSTQEQLSDDNTVDHAEEAEDEMAERQRRGYLAHSLRFDRRRNPNITNNSWFEFSRLIKAQLLDVLHLYTGFLKLSLVKRCRPIFTEELKDALLSDDERKIRWAVRTILPPEKRQHLVLEQAWMKGMSMSDSIKVIKKIANAAQKNPEHVRNYFLRTQLSAEKAHEILRATTKEELQWYVLQLGLDRPNNKAVKKGPHTVTSPTIETWPWMKGLSQRLKEKVIQRMMKAVKGLTELDCYQLLKQPHVIEEYGRIFIVADEDQVKGMMRRLMAGGSEERFEPVSMSQ